MKMEKRLQFTRVSDEPLLDLAAVPWATEKRTIMVPTVLDMSMYLGEPIDQFYMYYAPHHSQGIGLATAPHPEGPWTPYPGNPIITLDQFSGIRGHISAMEILYQPEEGRFLAYPHGVGLKSGQDTVIGSSVDGVHFAEIPDAPILSSDPAGTWEQGGASYLRVSRYKDMIYGIVKSERQHGLVRSSDGINWDYWPRNPLIEPVAEESEFDRIRHTSVIIIQDIMYFFYSTYTGAECSCEVIKLATWTLADDWNDWGELKRLGPILEAKLPWEENNIRDPFILRYGETVYMYYVGGNEKGIALTKIPYKDLNEHATTIK